MHVRLDKYLSMLELVPRRQIGKVLASGSVTVDGEIVYKSDVKLTFGQVIDFAGREIIVKEHAYVLLHKPAGYISGELAEGWHLSYKVLLEDCVYAPMLHVAWRLDQDTEWLLLCVSDGQFTHKVISPKTHWEKEYFVRTKNEVTADMLEKLSSWVVFLPWYPWWGREDGYKTLPAKAFCVNQDGVMCDFSDSDRDPYALRLVITEWKFHQVKRMLLAVWNEVVYLRRDRIGEFVLGDLEKGKWREIEIKK